MGEKTRRERTTVEIKASTNGDIFSMQLESTQSVANLEAKVIRGLC